MVEEKDFGNYETAWCPGCGNFGILNAMKKAFSQLDLPPHKIALFSGIGQAAKGPHYINANILNGLHGRSIPMATAAKTANSELTVIVQSGDGCNYAEGGNHFIHGIRRNPDITVFSHDNQVYGLTKGQASPTSEKGFTNDAQPLGAPWEPFNPVLVAVAMKAAFVARGYAGKMDHLVDLMKQAIQFKGFALVDIFQTCVSMNKVNTWQWYNERVEELPEDYDPTDWHKAIETASTLGDRIPIGVIYKKEKPVFGDNFPALKDSPLIDNELDMKKVSEIMESMG